MQPREKPRPQEGFRRPEGGPPGGPGGFGPPGGGPGGFASREYPVVSANIQIANTALTNVGVRFKGNSSFNFARSHPKKSFKLDFDHYEPSQHFHGLAKLNLNNNAMDASLIRETLAYQAFRNAGIPAPRTAFAQVSLNIPGVVSQQDLGVYTVVEQIDKTFLERHFGSKAVLLMKPERMHGLVYLGEDWKAYEARYEVKSKGSEAQRARFIAFTRWLKESAPSEFETRLNEWMDVDEFLSFVAINALLSNLDSALGSGHNFYIALDPRSQKFVWLPWDLNEAFGRFRLGLSADEILRLDLFHPWAGQDGLLERLFATPSIRTRYADRCRELVSTVFETRHFSAAAQAAVDVIAEPAAKEFHISQQAFRENAAGATAALGPKNSEPGADIAPDREPRPGGFSGPPRAGDFEALRRGQEGRSMVAWMEERLVHVRAQLAGSETGVSPRMGRPMGGPGGPGGPGPNRPPRPRDLGPEPR